MPTCPREGLLCVAQEFWLKALAHLQAARSEAIAAAVTAAAAAAAAAAAVAGAAANWAYWYLL